MTKQVKRLYEFGPFHLDTTEGVLRRNGREIVLRPKENLVLLTLVENSRHVVTKEVFLEKCWPDRFVEEANITVAISSLRRILDEEGDGYEYIETVPKRGYRFTASVKQIVFEDSIPTYSDVRPAESNGQYKLTLDATINDIDKPIAEAIEAILRKISNDFTVTIRKIDVGSVILTLEGTRAGFERIRELAESGQLTDILGFDIEDLRWEVSSESREIEPQYTTPSYPENISRLEDGAVQAEGTLALALAQSTFDKLLLWLGADREQAGVRYEMIRQKLIRLFKVRGATDPEDLADETIDRVAQEIEDGLEITAIPPEIYFYGVARNILQEHWRSHYPNESADASQTAEVIDNKRMHELVEAALLNLSDKDRELIVTYYEQSDRKNLAERLGITPNALRIRIARIRKKLEEYTSDYIKQSQKES